ncbi:lytic transglycosylase domain-containing protein [Swingsia samuiensis]|uniref:Lytic transglycosylase domain-containing protein n=1 Tax=Swingsia samuiensis TaxID=1293412 RepID=A0A4Y6UI31_9PROT|nr:lytic transglycosylase domain-containing protein [Swingsia samuiensis]QDH17172.1 lytic transglycosylase domain-containing protein [Swingsia samuiensis]
MSCIAAPLQSSLRSFALLRSSCALGLIGLLAACASTPGQGGSYSQVPVTQEAANYRAHAKSYYAPPGPPEDPWGPYIQEASDRFDVPTQWIRAVMRQESGGHLFDRDGNFITSVPGAMGLLQLMPPTYDDMRQQYNLGDDPYDPHDNILAGTAYIRQMYNIYGSPGFLAAYNDGPGSLDSYLRRGRPLPRETRRYVAAIGPHIVGYYPHNRSDADLLVSQHDPNAQVQLADNSTPVSYGNNSVSSAWAQKTASSSYTPPAEAVSDDNYSPSPSSVSSAWASRGIASSTPIASSKSSVSSAWASRGLVSPTPAVTTPSNVSSAWAARGIQPSADTTSQPIPEEAASFNDEDNNVTAQEIPIGHHLKPQPIMALAPASRHVEYRMPTPVARQRVSSPVSSEPHNWAIQVGAFSNARQAASAASSAHAHGGSLLASSRAQIVNVRVGKNHLYRARLSGLSHENAVAACRHLAHGSPCIVVPPGAE